MIGKTTHSSSTNSSPRLFTRTPQAKQLSQGSLRLHRPKCGSSAGGLITGKTSFSQSACSRVSICLTATQREGANHVAKLVRRAKTDLCTRELVSIVLGVLISKVNVISHFLGVGFGCKGYVWPHTLLASVSRRRNVTCLNCDIAPHGGLAQQSQSRRVQSASLASAVSLRESKASAVW